MAAGRRRTWASPHFARRYPRVSVNRRCCTWTTAPAHLGRHRAGLDCCLHLIRERYGAESANAGAGFWSRRRIARAGRRSTSTIRCRRRRAIRLAELLAWVREHLAEAHSLDSLADKALMSRRTFTRHFRQLTGATVSQWLLAERLALTQRLLEGTDHPVERIAQLAGMGSPESLRHHFRQALGFRPAPGGRLFAAPEPDDFRDNCRVSTLTYPSPP